MAEIISPDALNDIIDTPPALARGRVFVAMTRETLSLDEPEVGGS